MAYIGKSYKHQKNERFEEFLGSLGMAQEKVKAIADSCPTQKLEKNGDTYTLTTSDAFGTKPVSFKSGVEFEEVVSDNVTAKSTFTVDGNVVTQVQKLPEGKTITLKREYSDNELLVTLTFSSWDGSAKRYYIAA